MRRSANRRPAKASPAAPGASRPPTAETRAAVWRWAGPQREQGGLERLLADPYPLARMIARSLERQESRGAHRRVDFPLPDSALDGSHLVVVADGEDRLERWI